MKENKFSQRQRKFHSCSCCVICVTDSPALKTFPLLRVKKGAVWLFLFGEVMLIWEGNK